MHDGRILATFDNGWYKAFEENECTTCWCKGGTLDGDSQGDGAWTQYMQYLTPCPDCLDKGLCPGCRNKTINTELDTCVICGWEYSNDRFYSYDDDY